MKMLPSELWNFRSQASLLPGAKVPYMEWKYRGIFTLSVIGLFYLGLFAAAPLPMVSTVSELNALTLTTSLPKFLIF